MRPVPTWNCCIMQHGRWALAWSVIDRHCWENCALENPALFRNGHAWGPGTFERSIFSRWPVKTTCLDCLNETNCTAVPSKGFRSNMRVKQIRTWCIFARWSQCFGGMLYGTKATHIAAWCTGVYRHVSVKSAIRASKTNIAIVNRIGARQRCVIK